jgi:hypothetical protein
MMLLSWVKPTSILGNGLLRRSHSSTVVVPSSRRYTLSSLSVIAVYWTSPSLLPSHHFTALVVAIEVRLSFRSYQRPLPLPRVPYEPTTCDWVSPWDRWKGWYFFEDVRVHSQPRASRARNKGWSYRLLGRCRRWAFSGLLPKRRTALFASSREWSFNRRWGRIGPAALAFLKIACADRPAAHSPPWSHHRYYG